MFIIKYKVYLHVYVHLLVSLLIKLNLPLVKLLKPTRSCCYCCTVHFEDSLNISHQQMHQMYIIY